VNCVQVAPPDRVVYVSESSILITPMRTQHVSDAVGAHLDSFPESFLAFLGPSFLRLLYSEILKMPDHVAFVALDGSGTLVGFVAGVSRQSSFYARLVRRRWFAFAAASLQAVVRRPTILPRLVRALSYSKASQAAASPALLMSIGVIPRMRGRGVGRHLVIHFLTVMKLKDVTSVSLTTDGHANEHVNSFLPTPWFPDCSNLRHARGPLDERVCR
jgi:GNAT superfamily N-acetyltransferase